MRLPVIRLLVLGSILSIAGCGDNVEPLPPAVVPPSDVKALSIDRGTVGLQWSAPFGFPDSSIAAFIVTYGSNRDSLPRSSRSYRAGNLSSRAVTFELQTLSTAGVYSARAVRTWAPAERFDSVYVIYEADVSNLARPAALNLGSATTEPSTVPVALGAQPPFDLYLLGAAGQPLSLLGGHLYNSAWDSTHFADTLSPSASLDMYLSEFPNVFPLSEVPVQNNAVYYVRVPGEPGERHVARIHVRTLGGTFPDRSIGVQISLQRVPGLLYAFRPGRPGFEFTVEAALIPAPAGML